MAAVQTEDWRQTARELREAGLEHDEIARSVGRAESTVRKFLKAEGVEPGDDDGNTITPGETPSPDAAPDTVIDPGVPAETDEPGKSPVEPQPEQHRPNTKGVPPFQIERARLEQDGSLGWESETAYTEHIRVDGTSQVALNLGGKVATAAVLKISGKAEVDGFYRKGERVRFTGEAVITGVAVKDKLDKPTGIVMDAEESYTALIVDLRVTA